MRDYSEVYIGIDTSKLRHAVAVAEGGRGGEVRFLGEIEASEPAVRTLARQLAAKHGKLLFCYEAGPTGYGLYRLIEKLGHACMVVAPSMTPRKPGDRVKTNRRDALSLARLLRAGELTSVWAPDERHEAMRDLVRAREAAAADLRCKRQQLSALLLRLGRHYTGKKTWGRAHMGWLMGQKLAHREQRIVFEETMQALREAQARMARLEQAIGAARAGLVAGRDGHGVDGDARHRSDRGNDDPGGDRRSRPLSNAARVDGLARSRAERGFDRRQGQTRRHHQDRQRPGAAHAGGMRLELSPSPASGAR